MISSNRSSLRYGMLLPLALMVVLFISCCISYSNASQSISDDLNDAMLALAKENSKQWIRPDTIAE